MSECPQIFKNTRIVLRFSVALSRDREPSGLGGHHAPLGARFLHRGVVCRRVGLYQHRGRRGWHRQDSVLPVSHPFSAHTDRSPAPAHLTAYLCRQPSQVSQGSQVQGGTMKYKALTCAAALSLAPLLFATAADENAKNEKERLHNAGTVVDEILNIPDDIPQDLLDKARCVVVMPSVLKAAFVVGGSYGRGTMVCRTGKDFTGPWSAPAMYALEGGSVGLQIG